MIKYIKRADLDIEKYNACLDNSSNSRIYAYSWYLDIVATNWDALILDDYKAVMPLPWRQKYLIKYIYKPCWTQQLGVFSEEKIDAALVRQFIKVIPRKFKKITIQFNTENPISGKGITKKVNYILGLDKDYGELFLGYKSVRRRRKKKLINNLVKIETIKNISEIIVLHKNHKRFSNAKSDLPNYQALNELAICLNNKDQIDIVVARDKAGKTLGGALFLKDNYRVTYLFSAISEKGREGQVMTLVIDSIIEKYSKTNFTLDFEGSMIPGISFFFRSFGAIVEDYKVYQKGISLF